MPRHADPDRDRLGPWLHAATFGLCGLAGAAAAVSFSAQYGLESGQEADEWPDFLPPGWSSCYDGSSSPWS